VTLGAVAGLVASVAMGVAVTFLSGPLLDLGPDLVAAGVMFLAAAVLTWHGWWMGRHAGDIQGEVLRRIDDAQSTRRVWVLAVIAFTGVFREGAETVLFLWGLLTQAAVTGWGGAIAGTLGVGAAAVLGWLVFRGARRVPLRYFFVGTSALLLLVAAGLTSTGVGRLEGLALLPSSPTAWDTSWLLDDRSLVGSFVAGIVGYRARPSVLEALTYVVYLLVAGVLVLRPSPVPRRAAQRSLSR
jgi:high-affinity iron transporter